MSLPEFPSIEKPITLDDSLNMILASIAMEEIGLSHIINAESEKLRYVLNCTEHKHGIKPSVKELLDINKSIKSLLDTVMQTQIILKSKMDNALCALDEHVRYITGPTGPTGPEGRTCLCAASFQGCGNQCVFDGKALKWSENCCCCNTACLSPDGRTIYLNERGCYTVSFTLDLCVSECCEKSLPVCLQTVCGKTDKFICHIPIAYENAPFTASANGILISAHTTPAELSLKFLSPCTARIRQASICIIKISGE